MVRYGLAALLVTLLGIGLAWPWLGETGRNGLMVAAAIAWTVQTAAFAVLVRFRESARGFLAAWVGGTLVRMGLILLAAWAVVRFPGLPPAPTLLGLAGFFFGLLLLEPLFFGPGGTDGPGASPGDARDAPGRGTTIDTLDTATMDTA